MRSWRAPPTRRRWAPAHLAAVVVCAPPRLAPAVLNLNDLVLGIAELLKRSLGERITLTTVLARALWPTRADPSEVENAVLNLAINARDAMPKGGKLVIETGNVTMRRSSRPPSGARALRSGRLRVHIRDRHRRRHDRLRS